MHCQTVLGGGNAMPILSKERLLPAACHGVHMGDSLVEAHSCQMEESACDVWHAGLCDCTLSMKVFSARVVLWWPDLGVGAVIS